MNDKLEIFNELVNSNDRFVYHSRELIVHRVKFARTLGRIINGTLYHPEKPYRLYILYKDTHRVKRIAGRCFVWDETEETRRGIDVESGEQGFGAPRFDGMLAGAFLTDHCVTVFGDARLIAEKGIDKSGKGVLCTVYLRGRLTEQFKIRWDVFNRILAQGLVEK